MKSGVVCVLLLACGQLPAQTLELRDSNGELVTEIALGTRVTSKGFRVQCSDGSQHPFVSTEPAIWLNSATLPLDVNAGITPTQFVVTAFPEQVAWGSVSTTTLRIQVTDVSGIPALLIPVTLYHGSPMFIASSALPDAITGSPYFFQFTAYGGSGLYTWSVAAGSLPPGMSLALDFISGTAGNAEGSYSFTIAARDEFGTTVSKVFSLRVKQGPLVVSTTSLPDACRGQPYKGDLSEDVVLKSLGGTLTGRTWSLAAGSALPAGLVVSPDGLISGTATGTASTVQFTVRVSDSGGNTALKELTITVRPELQFSGGSTLPQARVNQPYLLTLSATGGKGVSYSFAYSGTLPPGLSWNVIGTGSRYEIAGTPTVAGEHTFTILTSNYGWTTGTLVRLAVSAESPPLQITTGGLAEGMVGAQYSQGLSAAGGSGTGYQWSVAGSGLQAAGVSLAGSMIQGTPGAAGIFQVPLTVTDSTGASAMKTLQLVVMQSNTPRITTAFLPGGMAGAFYSQTMQAEGTAPFQWSGPQLAPGLAMDVNSGVVSGTPTTHGTFTMRVGVRDQSGRSVEILMPLVVQRAPEQNARLAYFPIAPCRVMETRAEYNYQGHTGALGPPSLRANETRVLKLSTSNVCSVPANARAYVLNVTIIPRMFGSSFTIFPGGEQLPNFWTIRSLSSTIVANSAIVPVSGNGEIQIYSTHEADVVVDISGYFREPGADAGTVFYPVTPCRAVDTRQEYRPVAGPFGPPTLNRAETRRIPLASSGDCSFPPGVTAYSATITVVPKVTLPFFALWPSGQPQPNVSSINSFQGQILANSAIVPAGAGGSVEAYAYDSTDLIVDINGYFAPDDGQRGLYFYPVVQCRLAPNIALSEQASTVSPTMTSSVCGPIPIGAKAYALNFTARPLGLPMPFLTAYPSGSPRPNTSILNAFEGQLVTNSAIIPTGINGGVDVFAYRPTGATVEVSGYFLR